MVFGDNLPNIRHNSANKVMGISLNWFDRSVWFTAMLSDTVLHRNDGR
jgi:hypothetical protein